MIMMELASKVVRSCKKPDYKKPIKNIKETHQLLPIHFRPSRPRLLSLVALVSGVAPRRGLGDLPWADRLQRPAGERGLFDPPRRWSVRATGGPAVGEKAVQAVEGLYTEARGCPQSTSRLL